MHIFVLVLCIVSLATCNYTTCVQGIFDYEDAYAHMKLDLLGKIGGT